MTAIHKLGLSGRYRVVVSSDEDFSDIKHDLSFDNLITDLGLEMIGSYRPSGTEWYRFSGLLRHFCVGGSNVAPSFSDTSLFSLIATSPAIQQNSSAGQENGFTDLINGYMSNTYTIQFAQGAAAGNLSEIGIGPSNNQLFSRALIVDAAGNPTTITILPTDFLLVYYTLRINIPSGVASFVIDADIDGNIQPVTVDVSVASANYGLSATDNNGAFRRFGGCLGMRGGAVFYNASGGSIGDVTDPVANIGTVEYVAGSKENIGSISVGIGAGNVGGGLIDRIQYTFGPFRWQAKFTPNIPKDNTRTLEFSCGYTWARA